MNERTDAVLAAIDGALMDPELPDGMRWSPEPETVKDPEAMPYDGELVPIPHQHYEPGSWGPPADRRPRATVQYRHPGGEWEDAVLGPDGWRPRQWQTLGTLTPESTATFHDTIREAVRADLHRRAERIQADARAALPRVTVSPRPGLAPDLLIVEELGPGAVSVRRATDEEVSELLGEVMRRLVEAVTPVFEAVGSAFRQMGRALFGAADSGAAVAELDTPEARRAAALEARRTRPSGPAVVGPERAPGPRRGPSPATTPRGRQRPRQGRER